jgi:hypothetical protein
VNTRRQRVIVTLLLAVAAATVAFCWKPVYRMLSPEGRFAGAWEYRPAGTRVRLDPDAYTLRGLGWRYRGVVPFLTTPESGEAAVTAEYQYRVRGDTVIYRNAATGAEVGRRFEFSDSGELLIDGKLRFVRVKTR